MGGTEPATLLATAAQIPETRSRMPALFRASRNDQDFGANINLEKPGSQTFSEAIALLWTVYRLTGQLAFHQFGMGSAV